MHKLKAFKKHILFSLAILGILSLNFMLAFNADLKKQAYSLINSPFRKVTSVLISKVVAKQPIKIVKIQTSQGLFLEVYGVKQRNAQPLLSKVKLQDPHDGYFQFATQSSNLALSDINNDGVLDIVSVGFDKNQKGHLSIYNFNYDTNSLVFLYRK
ncbi:MAG: hypothetical protein HAW63_00885 [Bdellovibrionaceae bacterium]|nr:hypothetical protein [Pseudobdellovibrionaceae bacterium]